ncbi:MAG: MFS transporter [Pirellulales bacterium]
MQKRFGPHIVIAFFAFISLGLPDAVTGVAWPSLEHDFRIHAGYFGLILAGLSTGYCVSSMAAGKLLHRWGVAALLSVSCLLVSIAMAADAFANRWWLFVINAVVWGLGSGAIDTGLNHYAAKHFPPRIMNWLHACYSFGAAIGPVAMSAAILQFGSWRWGYAFVAAAMLSMMLTFLATRRQWQEAEQANPATTEERSASGPQTSNPRESIALHIAIFFVYTGMEALIGQWSYSLLTQSRGFAPAWATFWVSSYFFSIGAGRVAAGFIVNRVGVDRLVRCSIFAAVVGASLLMSLSSTGAEGPALILIGWGLAPVFPCLMSRTPERLGSESAAHAIGFQIAAAIIGVSAVPGLAGWLVVRFGMEAVAVLAVLDVVLIMAVHERMLKLDRRSIAIEPDSSSPDA